LQPNTAKNNKLFILGPPLALKGSGRLLPLVIELRPKGLVVVSGLAAVLGPPAAKLQALRFAARYSLGPAAALPPWSGLRPLLHIARPFGLRPLREQLPQFITF